jgi:SrtB family sortase
VVFTFNSTALIGKTVVVFESLTIGDAEIAAHADIGDEGQTVRFKTPEIGTAAKAEDGGKTVPLAETVTVIDTVAYENLAVGKEYVLKGTLMDRESGRPLMSAGQPVTAEMRFTPAAASGTVEVRFTFDSRAIGGRTLVVFEALEYEGVEIAAHVDMTDEGQSVTADTPEPAPTPEPPAPETPEPGKPVPQTGDDYLVVVWLALAAVSLPGLLAGIVFLRKKKRKTLVACILCAALLIGSAIMAVCEIQQYADNADAYEKLEQLVAAPAPGSGDAPEPNETGTPPTIAPAETTGEDAQASASPHPAVDFNALREINPDITGWLICEDTNINYPIARGADNSRYLNRLYDGSRGKAGTLFLDYENSADFSDPNSIVYGHNLLDGSMFSCLTEYGDQAYYDAHPSMLLLTPGGNYRVEVFAAFAASPNESGRDTSPWRQVWDAEEDFTAWLTQAAARSVIETDVTPAEGDTVLTLSTCTRGGRNRFLVMGRLVPTE